MTYEILCGVLLMVCIGLWLFRPVRYLPGSDWLKVEKALGVVCVQYGASVLLQFDASGAWSVNYNQGYTEKIRWTLADGSTLAELIQWADNTIEAGVQQ